MRRFFLFSILAVYSLFFVHSLFPFLPWVKKDTIYITPGLVGWLGETGKHKGIPFYGLHLPTLFKKYGLKVKTAKHLRKCPQAKKIVNLEVIDDKARYFKFYPSSKMVLFLFEPPSVLPQNYDKKYHKYFSKIYTFNDDLVDNKKYFKFYYPEYKPMRKDYRPFKEKKLCTLISRNKKSTHPFELYSERIKAIRSFEKLALEDFDLYGQFWDCKEFPSYKGELSSKDALLGYKFNIAYENISSINGYITEKIFDTFHYGCVPVYLGAPNVEKYIPKNCFIDRRDFASDEELYYFLKNMDESQYNDYLQNIENFLNSKEAKLFSAEHFFQILKDAFDVKD
jgi:hypothetical protein